MAKFQVGQYLRFIEAPSRYKVIKTPETCIHNDQPAYLLQHITLGPKTAPFHRNQTDVETGWELHHNQNDY